MNVIVMEAYGVHNKNRDNARDDGPLLLEQASPYGKAQKTCSSGTWEIGKDIAC